jgi:hypothetical protein
VHNNVVCPRSEVGYLHVMCSCSADGCSHDNICCYSTGGCSRDFYFVLQENVPHDNIISPRSEAGYSHENVTYSCTVGKC